MPSQLHPLQTTDLIRASYLRYLKTIYPFQDQDLREQFWQALEQPDMVVKGPLLEASPPFQTGRSLAQFIAAGVLHPSFQELDSPTLPLERPLYLHQDRAIEKVVRGERNLIVATGTGSGKTETFLIPILDHLLRQRAAGLRSPGVRALLLYPMNALANDQLKRLRRILAHFPDITFGRYTGETKDDYRDAEKSFYEQFPREPRLPNELISRTQMRSTPPHILLTNYAMLEYLLLRPRDNTFFDGPDARYWRFIVLDEAHVYDGASGIEIAMLLRRLKDRVVQSEKGRLCCLATSATLGRGAADYPAVVTFAAELFGEPFEWDVGVSDRQDVVEAIRQIPEALGDTWGEGSPELYPALQGVLTAEVQDASDGLMSGVASLLKIAEAHSVPDQVIRETRQETVAAAPEARLNACLYALLRGDQRLRRLQAALVEEPRFLSDMAEIIFPKTDDAAEMLISLVNLAVRARPQPEDRSLLPARYHVFARALEGAFTCLNTTAHTVSQRRLFLTRREQCPHCAAKVFELATCPRCGTPYLVGRSVAHDDHLNPALEFDNLDYFVFSDQVAAPDEDEAVTAEEEVDDLADKEVEPYMLCGRCGAIAPGLKVNPGCACPDVHHLTIFRVTFHRKRGEVQRGPTELTRCVACGSRSPTGIIYRFLTGQDAPASVLATSLYQNLPPLADPDMTGLPGAGRKLLSFADSRQDAAFFAPYMERTYGQLLRRRLILKTLIDHPEGRSGQLRLQDLVTPLLFQAESVGQFTQKQSRFEKQTLVKTWLMQELVALDRRISLEGLGLLRFRLVRPDRWSPPAPLLATPWNLSPEQAWQLLELLLDTLRQQGAVTFLEQVDPRDEAFAPRNRLLYVRQERAAAKSGIFGWLPSRGSNRRLDILLKLLKRQTQLGTANLSGEEQKRVALETLTGLWRHLTDPGSVWRDHLPGENLKQEGIVHHLSHLFWEVVPVAETKTMVYRCRRCQNVFYINLHSLCPTYDCQGQLEPLDSQQPDWEQNHYRYLYQYLLPIPFSAREHTAQWTSSEASRVQEQFVQGEINALSCSTTFELGVDVGELQVVLMRNMPPTTANYVQRAGRAGRRTDSAAFALTYAQRRSHDLTHYTRPHRIVAGKIRPPTVVVVNEKIVRRHMHSVLFAAFLRWAKEQLNREFSKVGDFFVMESTGSSQSLAAGPELLHQFVATRPATLKKALERIVPPDLQTELGIADWSWLSQLFGDDQDGILDLAEREVIGDLAEFQKMIQEAVNDRNFRQADYFNNAANTIKRRDLFGFLGSRNVLPKYGFPTDVVELRTSHLPNEEARRIELQRDLRMAIAEYAPGGEIVAGGQVWTSGGLYKQLNREWPQYSYAICPECGRFHRSLAPISGSCNACGASMVGGRQLGGSFIVPEFGFIVASEPKPSGEARPKRTYATRVYFAEYAPPSTRQSNNETGITEPPLEQADEISSSQVQVCRRYSRYGKLALVNAGPLRRGFRVCGWCGFAEPVPPPASPSKKKKVEGHKNPRTGKNCKGFLQTFHLGHEFITDVLELRFDGLLANNPRYNLWWSVLFGLLEGASEALGIRRDDLDGTIYRRPGTEIPALVLFDNVPGGAGHVRRIADELIPTFQAAFERLDRCECGEETSCYECLRNFRNQPYHDQLQRGPARDFLRQVLETAGVQV